MPHLKAGNSEVAGVVRRSHDGNQEGAVGYVLLIELHRDLVITLRERESKSDRETLLSNYQSELLAHFLHRAPER